jgi:hypothetical protein
MIQLGSCDPDVTDAACASYEADVAAITRLPLTQVLPGADKFMLSRQATALDTRVADVQRTLKSIGFFPGGKVDGICGYRTISAIRLFQEYVRSIEQLECTPDGRFGPQSQQHLQRWVAKNQTPYWTATIAEWQSGTLGPCEYTEWLELLERVKARYLATPSSMLQLVNTASGSDTRAVRAWDFSAAGSPQLIGLRRIVYRGKFEDIFVLLLKGLVFKFQGSTEPGASEDARGTPFLVQGQHDYHFGWHKKSYLALRPRSSGVLVVRSKNDRQLDAADLAGGVQPEPSINIHWGGMGLVRDVRKWSEGCQVINGAVYLNARGDLVDCSAFGAITPDQATDPNAGKTRGAYTMLLDLVTALASDLPGNAVRYMLLVEDDLTLAPALEQGLAQARERVMRLAG